MYMNDNLPMVSIVMAVYNPDTVWLAKQLDSLNRQDYGGPVELLVWNDSPDFEGCGELLAKHITRFPFRLMSDGKNHGATRAFENLARAAAGKYIAFCDQDDIWLPEKISASVRVMEKDESCLICHVGISLIDAGGMIFRHLSYPADLTVVNSSTYQQQRFVLRNFAFGCAMLVRSDFVRSVLPFPGGGVYHDQWLACCAAYTGRVVFIGEKLLLHRLHENNNSGLLHGIATRSDYYEKKLVRDTSLARALCQKYALPQHSSARQEAHGQKSGQPLPGGRQEHPANTEDKCRRSDAAAAERDEGEAVFLAMLSAWTEARNLYARHAGIKNFFRLLGFLSGKHSALRPDITAFELLMPFMPDRLLGSLLKNFRYLG